MRILYVEDNPANLFLIKRVAKMGEHEVINLIDGEEALRKIELIKPDLILMDIQLAGELTGLDVVRKLRSIGHTMPIIAVTAYAMVGDRERCLDAGCNEYLSKPLPIGRVVELLQMYQSEHTTYSPPKGHTQEVKALEAAAPVAIVPAISEAPPPVTPVPLQSDDQPAPVTSASNAISSADASVTAAPVTPVSNAVSSPDAPVTAIPAAPDVLPASDVLPSAETPTMPAIPASKDAPVSDDDIASETVTPNHSSAQPSEPPKLASGTETVPAIASTSQDTSHPQDTVQAQ